MDDRLLHIKSAADGMFTKFLGASAATSFVWLEQLETALDPVNSVLVTIGGLTLLWYKIRNERRRDKEYDEDMAELRRLRQEESKRDGRPK